MVVSTPARANDVPALGNRAAEEVAEIERGVFAVRDDSKAWMHVYSVFANKLAWQRKILDVCFWNGTTARQAEVIAIADELVATLPTKFRWRGTDGSVNHCPDYGNPSGGWNSYQVRVSLVANGNLLIKGDRSDAFFAMVGQQQANGRQATVNLPFSASDDTALVRSNVLHEFCHVLGCLHEFQRDLCVKDFKKSEIVKTFHLNDAQYADNFLSIPNSRGWGVTTSAAFDPTSITMYRLLPEWFQGPSVCAVVQLATKPSKLDTDGLARAYAFAGLSLSLDEFKPNASAARLAALEQRALASSLRAASTRLQSQLKDRGTEYLMPQNLALERLAKQAEEQALSADAEAETWELTSAEEKAIRRALSYFPDGA